MYSGANENLEMDEIHRSTADNKNESSEESEEKVDEKVKAKKLAILAKLKAIDSFGKVEKSTIRRVEVERAEEESSTMNKLDYEKELLKVLQGKERMNWARKIFLQTAEYIFPGVLETNDNSTNQGFAFKIRASIKLNVLLHGHFHFFWFWILAFVFTSDIRMLVLKNLHWILNICVSIAFSIINFARIYTGERGNRNDDIQSLAIFWMISVVIEIPFMIFLLLTDLYAPVFLPFCLVMHSVLCFFLFFESLVCFFHLQCLLRDEHKVILYTQKAEKSTSETPNAKFGMDNISKEKINRSTNIIRLTNEKESSQNSESELEPMKESIKPTKRLGKRTTNSSSSTSRRKSSLNGNHSLKVKQKVIKKVNKKKVSSDEEVDEEKNKENYIREDDGIYSYENNENTSEGDEDLESKSKQKKNNELTKIKPSTSTITSSKSRH